jgi:hypothetical protein
LYRRSELPALLTSGTSASSGPIRARADAAFSPGDIACRKSVDERLCSIEGIYERR